MKVYMVWSQQFIWEEEFVGVFATEEGAKKFIEDHKDSGDVLIYREEVLES